MNSFAKRRSGSSCRTSGNERISSWTPASSSSARRWRIVSGVPISAPAPTERFRSSAGIFARLRICLGDRTEESSGAVDALVIAPDGRAVLFDHSELMLDGLQITIDITGIGVLRNQFESNLFDLDSEKNGIHEAMATRVVAVVSSTRGKTHSP